MVTTSLKNTAATVSRAEGVKYLWQLKDNQKSLHEEVSEYFHKVRRDDTALYNVRYLEEIDGEHGWIVEREYCALTVSDWIKGNDCWQDIQSVIEVTRTREGKPAEVSHYISSLANDEQE